MPAKKAKELKATDLKTTVSLRKLKIKSSEDVEPCNSIISQERAIKAIKLGLKVKSKGYNIFATGLTGTGRSSTIKMLLEELNHVHPELNDVCYVNNFDDPDTPVALTFVAGEGKKFKKDIDLILDSLRRAIPKIYSSQDYKTRRNRVAADFESKNKALVHEFEEKMKAAGFVMMQFQIQEGIRNELQPVIDEEPISLGKLEKLVKEGKFQEDRYHTLVAEREKLRREMGTVEFESKKMLEKLDKALTDLDYSLISPLISDKLNVIKKKYPDHKIVDYLDKAEEALLADLDRFKEARPRRGEEEAPAFRKNEPFLEFGVNLVLDNSESKRTPIVVENNPTFRNMFGTTERVVDRFGYWRTDFTRIKGGSLLDANGGFLVINAVDIFSEAGVWQTLKRILTSGEHSIAGYDPFYQMAGSAIQPEPIPVNVKVVLIGDRRIYSLLYSNEEDFKKIFKIKADFDYVMEFNDCHVRDYVSFVGKITNDEKLIPFDNSALEELISYGIRLAGRKNKLSAQFTIIADIVREAAFCAIDKKRKKVSVKDVCEAINQRRDRVSLYEDKVQEMYDEGVILVKTTGKEVGMINGLSVYNTGEHSFGKPTRITVSASVGRAGVINIERESDLSGPIHNKGVLVLSGFLRGKFAKYKPLYMSASICFEQSYGGVDGDSASSTEIYAIMSALSGVPIDQGLAVTGSVNQFGMIQPIGGANEKIEGFFDVCKAKRLTGKQGVLIPIQNVPELQLKDDVIDAVKAKKFHIYPVTTIEEGIALLMGKPAGKELKNGGFTKGSIYDLVDKELDRLASKFKSSDDDKKNDKSKKK